MVRSLLVRIIPLLICSLAINYGGQVNLWGWLYSDSSQIERSPVKENIAESVSNTIAVPTRRNVTISGQLVRNDLPAIGLEGAQVSLTGTENYLTFSGVNGFFTLVEVIPHQNYTLTVSAAGFVTYNQQLAVDDDDLDLGIIVIYEYPYPPDNLIAVQTEDEEAVILTWDVPVVVDYYFFDFENNDGEWLPTANWDPVGDWEWTDAYDANDWYFSGSNNAVPPPLAHSGSGLWGTKINTNHSNSGGFSYLEKTFDLSGYNSTVLCFYSWNNTYGQFDYGQVRVNGMIVWGPSWDHQDTHWNLVEIDLSLYDGLPEVTIIFEHFATTTINYAGWYIDDVYVGPEVTYPPLNNLFSLANSALRSGSGESCNNPDNTRDQRVWENYRVYRFLSDDRDNPLVWDELAVLTENTYTDITWGEQQSGFYNYAVRAEYTDEILSLPVISNWLGKDMTTAMTVNVTTDVGDSAAGALVSLQYQNQDPDGERPLYVLTTMGEIPSVAFFDDILKGTYSIEVSKPGYSEYQEGNIAILNPLTIDIVLEEIPYPPEELTYTARGNFVSLNWRAPYPGNLRALQGYNVYRDGEQLNTNLIPDKVYYDTSVENGVSYTYYLTAVYSQLESEPSNTVTVIPGYDQLKIVGSEIATANTLPLNMYYRNSLSQTIYMAAEINMTGYVTQVRYYNSFTHDVLDKPVQVWMGETYRTTLAAGWIPSTELELVFDGNLDFPAGHNEIIIPLEEPFYFAGDRNLVLMVKRVMDQTNYNATNHFFYSIIPGFSQRSRNLQSHTIDYDPAEPSGGSLTSRVPNTGFLIETSGLGSIIGNISGVDDLPLNNTLVQIIGTDKFASSNSAGFFFFPYIDEGVYDLRASLFGYHDGLLENISVQEYEFTIADISLVPLQGITITGRVVGSDQPDQGLENADVTLSGYGEFTARTNDSGIFSLAGVYAGQGYLLIVTKEGYSPYSQEIETEEADLDLGDLVINEMAYPPNSVTALINPENNRETLIEWLPPQPPVDRRIPTGGQRDELKAMEPRSANGARTPERALVGYLIYRFRAGQEQNQENWSELATVSIEENSYIDTGLSDLLNGTYRYAVRSLYTNNILSLPAFSNTINYQEEIPHIADLQAMVDGNDVYLSWVVVDDNSRERRQGHSANTRKRNLSSREANRGFLGYKIARNEQLIAEGVQETSYFDQGLAAGDYVYSVIGEYTNGSSNMLYVEVSIHLTSGGDTQPGHFTTSLGGNFPNPFNAETSIFYALEEYSRVTIDLFNVRGQHLITLVDEYHTRGKYALNWDGKNYREQETGSGIILIRMKTATYLSTAKMILLK